MRDLLLRAKHLLDSANVGRAAGKPQGGSGGLAIAGGLRGERAIGMALIEGE